jgi:hypothetical protein
VIIQRINIMAVKSLFFKLNNLSNSHAMLIIRPDQMQSLTDRIRAQFAAKLTGQLQTEYPELFQPLPPRLALRMVSAKIDYAEYRYEIRFQSALTVFLHYCCAIGPAFDRQPDIQEVLDDLSLYPDDIPALLPDAVDEEAWEEAEQVARRADWFDPDQPGQLADQVAARMCWGLAALASHQPHIKLPPDETSLNQFVSQSISAAQSSQIRDADGVAAFALCQSLLGREFHRQADKPWVEAVFNDPAILPALRGATLAGCVELEWGIQL